MNLIRKLRESFSMQSSIRMATSDRMEKRGIPPLPGKFNHFSMDLECLSLSPRAAVLSIGLVAFDIHSGRIGPSMQVNVDYLADLEAGGEESDSTLEWWEKPENDEAWAAATSDPQSPEVALRYVDIFLQSYADRSQPRSLCIWTLGSEFDPPILNQMAERHHFKSAFYPKDDFISRRCLADLRTVYKMFPMLPKTDPKAVAHVALDDALAQAEHLILARSLGLNILNPLRTLP